MSEKELKPCPFCKFGETLVVKGIFYQGHCQHCYAKGPIGETRQAAIDAWNKRMEER